MKTLRFVSGVSVHLAFAVVLVLFLGPLQSQLPSVRSKQLVWTKQVGFDGGGNGGDGRRSAPAPHPRAHRPEPVPHLPAIPAPSSVVELPGVVAVLNAAESRGTGADQATDPGSGARRGPGRGDGEGPQAGPGAGPLDPGTPGLVAPVLLFERKPEYTSAAMQARIEGDVLIEAVVLPDGTIGDVRVVRSVDDRFGLAARAVEAVRGWKFRPGAHFGKPVSTRVFVELAFRIR